MSYRQAKEKAGPRNRTHPLLGGRASSIASSQLQDPVFDLDIELRIVLDWYPISGVFPSPSPESNMTLIKH